MSDHKITAAMLTYGGSFAKALAGLFLLADEENQRRIKATWTDYWAEYAEMALLSQERLERLQARKAEQATS